MPVTGKVSTPTWSVEKADCVEWLDSQEPDSADLLVCSPQYEEARLYLEGGEDLGIAKETEEWVEWMVTVCGAARRVVRGLCVFVVEGQTSGYRYSGAPFLLIADLCRKGFHLRKPPIYRRVGIPGSGGPDWLRNDYEPVICFTRGGKLPWSDNTAMGHPPKWAPGGEMSHRMSDGSRVNQWGHSFNKGGPTTSPDGTVKRNTRKPSHRLAGKVKGVDLFGEEIREEPRKEPGGRGRRADGTAKKRKKPNDEGYDAPVMANPGNVIQRLYTAEEVSEIVGEVSDIVDCRVGGGVMGNRLCHKNEAPFPEQLAEFFILSFCPPGGTVLDCFSGSGTTGAMAIKHGRNFKGCDLRQSQVDLSTRRLKGETPSLFSGIE